MSANKQLRFKHTQGKWKTSIQNVRTNDGILLPTFVNNDKGFPICEIHWNNKDRGGVKGNEAVENAKLIAAAPEMIKTLNAVRAAIFNHGQNIKKIDPVEWFDRLTQVINSAT